MDKFERVQQYCVNGELAIKSEGMEDTFKDIAVYSTLALILFRKEQEKNQELTELERGKGGESYDVDRDNGLGISLTARLNNFKESDIYKKSLAKKARDEEIALQDRDNRGSLFDDDFDDDEQVAKHKEGYQSDIEKLEEQRRVNKYNNLMEDEHEAWLRSKFPKDGENN